MINLSGKSSLSQKEEMARANGVPEWRLQYDIDFESVVRGHHIYKTMWKPEIGERLVCKKDDRKEAALYDENAIGVFKQLEVDQKPEFILVGHLPMEFSFFMHSFLKSRDDNILIKYRSNWSKKKGKWLGCTLCLPWTLNFFSSGKNTQKATNQG